MIKQKEYDKRRRQLMRMAGEDSIVVLQAAPPRIRNNDVHYPYRQDSDFLYLTGFREPSALLVMIPDEEKSILFCRERDPEREMWDGRMVGLEGAVKDYGMDEAYDIRERDQRLRKLLQDRDRIYHDLGRDPLFDQILIGWLNEFRGETRKTFHAPEEIHALDHMLHRFTRIVRGMKVNEERMLHNLELGRGLVFSGQLLLDLTARGMRREDAYRVVQDHAMQAWEAGEDFGELEFHGHTACDPSRGWVRACATSRSAYP